MKILLLAFAVIALASCSTYTVPAFQHNKVGRDHLCHTRVVTDYYRNHQQSNLRRHQLSDMHGDTFLQSPLETNHYGFMLDLKVEGFNYRMSMDTGSSDIFIKGEKAPGVPKKRYSDPDYKSKPRVSIGYLDGPLTTYATELNVEYANHTFSTPLLVSITAPEQFIDVEGLIGLSFPEIALHRPTFIETLINKQIINTYAYGMNLNLIQENRSFVSFGDKDPELYTGQLTEFPISHSKEIKVDFKYVTVGNSPQMAIPHALLDTGNTCISIPRNFQQTILSQFNTKNNKCVFDVEKNVPMFSLLICKINNFDELPTIKLNFGGPDYEIEKEYYLQRCSKHNGENYCETYIESVEYSQNAMIFLGDGFFNRFYTYFDLANSKVGVAKNRENITLDVILAQKTRYDPADWTAFNGKKRHN